jgi:hypothetical protein
MTHRATRRPQPPNPVGPLKVRLRENDEKRSGACLFED